MLFRSPIGAASVDQGALRRAIVDRFGVSPPLGRAADMARIAADTLRQRGYLNPAITPRPVLEHAPERATLVFTIDPGARTTIGDVAIAGHRAIGGAVLAASHVAIGGDWRMMALGR